MSELEQDPRGRKLVSLTLYGSNRRHIEPAVTLARAMRFGLGDWRPRFHVCTEGPDRVSQAIINRLVELDAEIVECGPNVARRAIFWRYWPLADPTVEAVFVCDTCRVFGQYVIGVAEAWLASGRDFMVLEARRAGAMIGEQMARGGRLPIKPYRADAGFFGARAIFPDIKATIESWLAGRSRLHRFDDNDFVTACIVPANDARIFHVDLAGSDLEQGRGRPRPCGDLEIASERRRRLEMFAGFRAGRCCHVELGGLMPCRHWIKGQGVAQNYCTGGDGEKLYLNDAWRDPRKHCPLDPPQW